MRDPSWKRGTRLGAACEEQDAGFGVRKAESGRQKMPSIRVVPPKYDIGPWMGIRCLFYSMELSYGSGMKIFLTYVLQQLYRIKTFAQDMYALMQEA